MKAKKKSSETTRKSAKRPATAQRTATREVTRKTRLQMPPILFEGDRPAPPRLSGPGEKFALGEHAPAQEIGTKELPDAYGTGRLLVITRDPHWLYAHWDFTREQQRRFNAQSAHGHLILRTYLGAPQGSPASEIHVHPESRHWFAHVERAATEYVAELGYYRRGRRGRQWARVATSATTLTPPDTLSPDTTVSFATIPVDVPFEKLLATVKQAAQGNVPLAQALKELRQRSQTELPAAMGAQTSTWTAEQERALAEVIRLDTSACAWMDSLQIADLVQGQSAPEVTSPGGAEFGLAAGPTGAEASVSSPSGGPAPGAKGFWFNLNVELVIYGATEHDASVTVGGQRITLRPDGSFSLRFALPDGQHELAVQAVSVDGTEGRAASLKFTRTTELAGDVGTHPQDPALKSPETKNVG